MAAPEKRAIIACNRHLVDGLAKKAMESIADDLYSNELIPSHVYYKILSSFEDREEIARDIVSNVTEILEANSKKFVIFIQALKDNKLQELAKRLEDKFGEYIKGPLDIINVRCINY